MELMNKAHLTRFLLSALVSVPLVFSLGCDLLDEMAAPTEVEEVSAAAIPGQVSPIDPDWQPPPVDVRPTTLPSVADVVARVKPSVVAISFLVTGRGFFDQEITQPGGGSGWIIDDSGIVVTNAHVVTAPGITSMTVTLHDGRVIEVDLNDIRFDLQTDLAVLKIDAENLTALEVGDSNRLRIGEWVVAVGNSLGSGVRATVGIVSQNEVTVNQELGQPLRLIETDAAINPGNSGGPLVNMAGEVIGINEAKALGAEIEGVGWAIASTDAMPIIQSLINLGYVVRPWLGVGTLTVTPTLAFRYQLPRDTGVVITSVAAGSPADLAGLEPGDVVVRFNGVDVTTDFEMVTGIHGAHIGDTVEIVFWREDSSRTVRATLVESPHP